MTRPAKSAPAPFSSPFPLSWWSFDLGDLRPCDGTYEMYAYDSVPALDAVPLTGDFAWLAEHAGESDIDDDAASTLAAMRTALEPQGLTLPAAFEKFMSDAALRDAVPSCTACEWDLSESPIPSKVEAGAYTIRFLRDQQDCLFWYLYLAPNRAPQVVCSPIPFDDPDIDEPADVVLENAWAVAPDFEAFVFRFWLENELWELCNDDLEDLGELTPIQRSYLKHYRTEDD